jgi:hypothetical protein
MTTLVFVHGWSVTDTTTYGSLPQRVQTQADAAGVPVEITDIWLSEYVTFDDRVTMDDLVRALDHALRGLQLAGGQFACITHSFGGSVVRAWLRAQREQPAAFSALKLSHLIMLAPASFGSALAQLGKGVLGKVKAWWNGVEPGQRILDWLELGSAESLSLNLDHIHGRDSLADGRYLFVLTGDRPDRSLYDFLNSYTGEVDSDGVVRTAAANLNTCHAVLRAPVRTPAATLDTLQLQLTRAPRSAFKLIAGASHMGARQGIMSSDHPATAEAIVRCLRVADAAGYHALCDAFDAENAVRDAGKVELDPVGPFPAHVTIHDACSMLIVRMVDDRGEALDTTAFLLTAGTPARPDWLPQGFMVDRQANRRSAGVYTMYLNHALLAGDERVPDPRDPQKTLRDARSAHRPYGCQLRPPDLDGLVHHALAISAVGDDFMQLFSAHQTTVLDVVLPRKLHEGLFRLTRTLAPEDFAKPVPGAVIG